MMGLMHKPREGGGRGAGGGELLQMADSDHSVHNPLPKTKDACGDADLRGLSSSRPFLVLLCPVKILSFEFYQSSRVRNRSESRGPPPGACHAPRL